MMSIIKEWKLNEDGGVKSIEKRVSKSYRLLLCHQSNEARGLLLFSITSLVLWALLLSKNNLMLS